MNPQAENPYAIAIGRRLAAARIAAAMTVEDAARAVMMDAKQLGRYERGSDLAPEVWLEALAGIYHTHPALLRYGSDAIAAAAAAIAEGTRGTPVTPLRAGRPSP